MNPRRIGVPLILAALVAFGACSGDDSGDPVSTSTSTSTSTPTVVDTTTILPPATSSSSTSPPTSTIPDTTSSTAAPSTIAAPGQEDLAVIVEGLYLKSDELFAAPDLARIEEVAFPGSPYAQHLQAQFGDFISRGERVVGRPVRDVISVENVTLDAGTVAESRFAMFDATLAGHPEGTDFGSIVDAAGNVVIPLTVSDPTAEQRVQIVLARYTATDPWRISQLNAPTG